MRKILLSIYCVATMVGCQTVNKIAADQYHYLPYSGNEVLYLSDSTSIDSLALCGYFSRYTNWGGEIFTRQHEIRHLRCAALNKECESNANYFLAYLFLDGQQNLGLGLNLNFENRKYQFGADVLLKDSVKYKQHVDFFDKEMLVIKDEGGSVTENVIEAIYWDLQTGLQGLKLKSGKVVVVTSNKKER